MEKRSLSYLIGTFIFLTVCGLTPALAQRRASPINLRGTYAVKSVGIATECTNIGGCDAASPTPEPRNFGAVAVAAFDENGNFCGTATATSSPTAGSPLPVEVTTRIVTGGLSSFDPIRAEGEVNFSVYEGGSCDRVVFESAGATLTTTGTAHVVVSDSGERIDGLIDTYIGTADQFGSVLVNLTLIKQFPGDDPSARARKDLSLADLAGAFSAKSDGTEALCTNSGGCDAASPTLIPLKFTADAHGTLDEAGKYCAVAGSASSPTVGSALGAFIGTKVTTGIVTSFDPKTGQGDTTLNEYVGGTCDGAGFNGRGAVLIATGTNHVVVSDSGKRLDSLVTSYTSVVGKIGGMVNTTTMILQTSGQ